MKKRAFLKLLAAVPTVALAGVEPKPQGTLRIRADGRFNVTCGKLVICGGVVANHTFRVVGNFHMIVWDGAVVENCIFILDEDQSLRLETRGSGLIRGCKFGPYGLPDIGNERPKPLNDYAVFGVKPGPV